MANTTTEIELSGIRMAATIGDNTPCTANPNPTKLYKNDIVKLIKIILILIFENSINFGNRLNFSASKIASLAGQKLPAHTPYPRMVVYDAIRDWHIDRACTAC